MKNGITLRQYFLHYEPNREGIEAILIEARKLADAPYDSANGMPANVHGIAAGIATEARTCLAYFDSEQTNAAIAAGFRLGSLCGELNGMMAAWASLQQKAAHRQERVDAANARHSRPGGSRELRSRIQDVWASGKYSSRDICAEQEWSELGFQSFATARKALRNTPDPT
ncbi:hypothetical protein [Stutzerimonas zhaodongensis]|uniref:hypothetical protein n=1 Tax=Stutzerimonas zhaodongensis TaxID=1176257 RepID=UPI002102FB49|nr:hypothetical protein [Stutzerimonas zhaodongensis]MCQ2028797.1 hypothetical protein [Stutzerimonas zhaodongensis]